MTAMLLAADAKFLDIISVNIWQMLISLANLLILFLILKHFLFRPVQKVLAKRGEEVGSLYDEAAAAKSDAEAARAEYNAKLEGADAEAEEILRHAQLKANERGEEIVAEAKREAEQLRRRAAEDIAQEKKKAINEIKDDISELSMEIAEQVITREVREEDHRALVDRFIVELGENSHE